METKHKKLPLLFHWKFQHCVFLNNCNRDPHSFTFASLESFEDFYFPLPPLFFLLISSLLSSVPDKWMVYNSLTALLEWSALWWFLESGCECVLGKAGVQITVCVTSAHSSVFSSVTIASLLLFTVNKRRLLMSEAHVSAALCCGHYCAVSGAN